MLVALGLGLSSCAQSAKVKIKQTRIQEFQQDNFSPIPHVLAMTKLQLKNLDWSRRSRSPRPWIGIVAQKKYLPLVKLKLKNVLSLADAKGVTIHWFVSHESGQTESQNGQTHSFDDRRQLLLKMDRMSQVSPCVFVIDSSIDLGHWTIQEKQQYHHLFSRFFYFDRYRF